MAKLIKELNAGGNKGYLDSSTILYNNEKLNKKLNEMLEPIKIVTDGTPVKTGRIIDGKDEYVSIQEIKNFPKFSSSIAVQNYDTKIPKTANVIDYNVTYHDANSNIYNKIPVTFGMNSSSSGASIEGFLVNTSSNYLGFRIIIYTSYNVDKCKLTVYFTN